MNFKYLPKWNIFFNIQNKKKYFINLKKQLNKEYTNYICFPKSKNIFILFNLIEPKNIKIVIIGQDPYYKNNQANGIAFSVNKGINIPRTLINIFQELKKDLNISHFFSGDLREWVKQGIFLFNVIWTVRKNKPLSHKNIGWLEFSKNLIIYLNDINNNIIYVLWGKYAKIYSLWIKNKNNIIQGSHPSPLSYYIFKNKHFFIKINKLLRKNKKEMIDWKK